MTSKQNQRVEDNSTAIQANRDVHYSSGISPEQMTEIFKSVQSLVQVFTEQSKDLIEERLGSFRENLMQEFAKIGGGRPEAFSDPDFQAALLDAQKNIARSGDKSLEHVLIDLVSQKSKCEKRDRLSLTLNDAILKSASLTDEDFDFLALIFTFKNMQLMHMDNVQMLADRLQKVFAPVAEGAAEGELAVSYLESHGCLRSAFKGIATFKSGYEILSRRYPGVFTRGVSSGLIETVFPIQSRIWQSNLIQESPLDASLNQMVLGSSETIDSIHEDLGLPERPGKAYHDLMLKHLMRDEEFFSVIHKLYDGAKGVIDKYDNSGARDCTLTSVGIALAHARLSKIEWFDAPLSVWVK